MIRFLYFIDLYTLSPKHLNSENSVIKSIESKYKKIKLNKNLFNKKIRKEKIKFNNKNKLASLDIENFFIYKRINDVTSIYQNKNFQRDFERSQIYKTNICKLPKINFKNYNRPLKFRETPKKMYKINYDNFNFNTLNTNLTLTSKNKYEYKCDDLDDIDYISLYFFLSSNLSTHPYIIIAYPDDFFYEVINKLCDTVPFLKKDNIIAYKMENEKKVKIQMFKTVKDNGINDKCKIRIEFE